MNRRNILLKEMIKYLLEEKNETNQILEDSSDLHTIWRSLINCRYANPISLKYLELEDEYLRMINNLQYNISDCIPTNNPRIFIFKGDITNLAVDAIVNSANSDMLGCFTPNHHCIDNAIHTYAGVRLRLECKLLMTKQGRKESVGQAKITSAYNLPSKYIIHTVGPYIEKGKEVSAIRKNLLKQSYLSCLKIAQQYGITTIAICAISTGEFGFPKEEACSIAISTVKDWLNKSDANLNVIFNLFNQEDFDLYHQQLLI